MAKAKPLSASGSARLSLEERERERLLAMVREPRPKATKAQIMAERFPEFMGPPEPPRALESLTVPRLRPGLPWRLQAVVQGKHGPEINRRVRYMSPTQHLRELKEWQDNQPTQTE